MYLVEEKAYNKLKKACINIAEKSSLPSLYISWPMNKFIVFRTLVANYKAKAKPNLAEVIANLAAAISSYTYCKHNICYPNYKYNPKKRIDKQLKQAAKEINGPTNIIPILHFNVSISSINYLLYSNNFNNYPFMSNDSLLYLQEDCFNFKTVNETTKETLRTIDENT
ncbi:hypothetical protein CONCODRAFT_13532 [Conidiobolus coronatus NRRL 28638]|uniref:Uncharacterized protein n=1 Tax=Conidiobolus coronatus (strain ATCC 28846 / CBS 209.66 / NRRL 28638) TaxID=796925 RepID=A0A137NQJ1_CONC2|nr:hypothetical protein CONCODRAFT_13532 [Conidiobolus coronatus NRRL 28638]|eukprot:KXN65029.1 hypothetical protein CONCODRAFT_13532 [Conidiobolus coronatus NRRL 28638]